MRLEDNINELLLDHDLVIVPRFGGFLAGYASARIDSARRIIHPPDRALSFNRDLERDDGLLTDAISVSHTLTFDDARSRVAKEVEQWTQELSNKGRLELDRIGVFYQDAERNLQFHPDRNAQHSKASFGLHPVPAVPLMREKAEVKKEAKVVPLPRPTEPVENEGPRRSEVMWAAAATAALLLGFSSWALWNSELGMGHKQLGELVPTSTKVEPQYRERSLPKVELQAKETSISFDLKDNGSGTMTVDITGDGKSLVAVHLNKNVPTIERPIGPTQVPDPIPKDVSPALPLRFHVVGGCFAERSNADSFVQKLREKGHDARQIDLHKGLYRVAYSSYPERTQALDKLTAVRKEGSPEAWLLIK